MGEHGVNEKIDIFLEDIVEQIEYKPIREEIKEELSAHIEDRKEEYIGQGIDESKAWKQAIEDMGDAVIIGAQLNEVHKVQKNKFTVILVMSLILIGVLGNIREILMDSGNGISEFSYFILGIIIFTIVYHYGFQKFVKNTKKYFGILVSIWGLYLIVYIVQSIYSSSVYLLPLGNLSLSFAVRLLSIPAIIGIAYINRSKKYKLFLITTVVVAAIIGISIWIPLSNYIVAANFVLLIVVYSTLMYMIVTGIVQGKAGTLVFSWVLSLGMIIAVLGFSFSGHWKHEFEQCFYPERVAQDYWDDAYNSILIKDLLGKAEMLGTINLGQEKLMGYYTDDWYFNNIDDFHYKYKLQFEDADSVKLEDVLPQHYQNNYRIAYWILKYGWIPSIVLLGIILVTYGMMIRMIRLMKNKMGKVLAVSCILTLIVQTAFYIFGNMGYQFGWFCNFPFISEGNCSIATNMILAGLACSAYRFDRVVKERKNEYRRKTF